MAQNLASGVGMQEQTDEAAILHTVRDYVDGWNYSDPMRMERSLHPHLVKRWVTDTIASSWPPGDRLDEMSALRLVQLARRDPGAQPRGDAWPPQTAVTILDRMANAASVKIWADADGEYLHLARWNRHWVIVNVLYVPPAPGEALRTYGPGDVEAAIMHAVRDYNESWDEGDAARVERSLHPHLAKRTVAPNGDSRDERAPSRAIDAA